MKRIVAVVLSALGGSALGAAVGVLLVKSRPRTGMGWDQIADGLGALVFGGTAGGLVFLIVAFRLKGGRALVFSTVTLILGPLLLVVAARMPSRPAATPPQLAPFEPTFVFQMFSRIAAVDPGPPPGVSRFPFRELRVDARTWELTSKGWGSAAQRSYCAADLDAAQLERLADVARQVFDESESSLQNCPEAGRATFSVSVEWQGETRGTASFGLACLDDGAPMAVFLDRFSDLHERVCR